MMIHHTPKQWNISLIMLFVLVIGSIIGLISTWYIQDMISSSGQIREFYNSYYITKWWLELGVLAVQKYDYGFEDNITGGNAIIANNLRCAQKKHCNLNITIQSRIKDITIDNTYWAINTCSTFTQNPFTLSQGQSLILPLFADERSLKKSAESYLNILPQYETTISSANLNSTIGIGIVLWSRNQTKYDEIDQKPKLFITGTIDYTNINNLLTNTLKPHFQDTITDSNDFNYLTITNMDENPFNFCLNIKNSFVWDSSIVHSIGTFWNTNLWFQADVKKPLLEYIIRPYWDGTYSE